MPFSLEHDGPARVNDYMLLTNESEEDGTTVRGRYSSSFRGRRIESTKLKLPEQHFGIVLSLPVKEDPIKQALATASNSTTNQSSTSKKAKTWNQDEEEGETSGLRRSPRKKAAGPSRFAASAIPVKKQIQKFSMDSDDDEDGDKDEDEVEVEVEVVKEVERQEDSEMLPSEEDQAQEEETVAEKVEDIRTLSPQATFGDSLLIWGADGQVDLGDDPYARGLGEWEAIANVVSSQLLKARV